MSVYENGSSFFLLHTDNFGPLLELIDQLSKKISENQGIIDRLTATIDRKFDYPDVVEIEKTKEVKEPNETNTLGLFLQEKYRLDQIRIPPGVDLSGTPTVSLLKRDIARLKILRQSNSAKNKQLFQIVQDYEMFLVRDVLPKMREDIQRYRESLFLDIKLRQLDQKLVGEGRLWSNYVLYLEHLNRLFAACEELTTLMDREIEGEELQIVEQKLKIVEEIRGYLVEEKV